MTSPTKHAAAVEVEALRKHSNYGLPSPYDVVLALLDRLAAAEAERDHLQKFKQYVHDRLDKAGVPTDPESEHKAKGCRIGGRLDWIEKRAGEYRKALEECRKLSFDFVEAASLPQVSNLPQAFTIFGLIYQHCDAALADQQHGGGEAQ